GRTRACPRRSKGMAEGRSMRGPWTVTAALMVLMTGACRRSESRAPAADAGPAATALSGPDAGVELTLPKLDGFLAYERLLRGEPAPSVRQIQRLSQATDGGDRALEEAYARRRWRTGAGGGAAGAGDREGPAPGGAAGGCRADGEAAPRAAGAVAEPHRGARQVGRCRGGHRARAREGGARAVGRLDEVRRRQPSQFWTMRMRPSTGSSVAYTSRSVAAGSGGPGTGESARSTARAIGNRRTLITSTRIFVPGPYRFSSRATSS